MAYGPRKKDELLEEYRHLSHVLPGFRERLNNRARDLRRHARSLDSIDLSWAEMAKGTGLDVQRLGIELDKLGGSPMTREVGTMLAAYRQQMVKPSWQRPRRDDWLALVAEVRRVVGLLVERRHKALEAAWERWRQDDRKLRVQEEALERIERALGDEIWRAWDRDRDAS